MKNTTLCYLEKDGKYLMLLRNKKEIDENKGKWIGVGGKFEAGESPEDCLIREVKEETGLDLIQYKLRGIVTFILNEKEAEYMFLYTADNYEGQIKECNEGKLAWIEKDMVSDLNLWEGDKIFLRLLKENAPFFSLKLNYRDDELIDSKIKIYG